ncbi:hypothetical protein KKB55_01105 [Myxococcota bacterium]|nr:hypothetical protein [Myxococcota bacterium]MBU1896351.1 hypothetical protein [Myxococcota bacterium]
MYNEDHNKSHSNTTDVDLNTSEYQRRNLESSREQSSEIFSFLQGNGSTKSTKKASSKNPEKLNHILTQKTKELKNWTVSKGIPWNKVSREFEQETSYYRNLISSGIANEDQINAFIERKKSEFEFENKYKLNLINKSRGNNVALWNKEEIDNIDDGFNMLPRKHVNQRLKKLSREKYKYNSRGEKTRAGGYNNGSDEIKFFDNGVVEGKHLFSHEGDESKYSGFNGKYKNLTHASVHEVGHSAHNIHPAALNKMKNIAGWTPLNQSTLLNLIRNSLGISITEAEDRIKYLNGINSNYKDQANRGKGYNQLQLPNGLTVVGDQYDLNNHRYFSFKTAIIPSGDGIYSSEKDGLGSNRGKKEDTWAYGRAHPREMFAEMYTKSVLVPEQLYSDMIKGPNQAVSDLEGQLESASSPQKRAQIEARLKVAKMMQNGRHDLWRTMRKDVFGVDQNLVNKRLAELKALTMKIDATHQRDVQRILKKFQAEVEIVMTPHQLNLLFNRARGELLNISSIAMDNMIDFSLF